MPKHAKKRGPLLQLGAFALAALLTASGMSATQATAALQPIDLGTAANFAVLAGSAITNTGATTITGTGGDIGSYPTRAFDSAAVATTGTKYEAADESAETVGILSKAKTDLQAAFNDAKGRQVPTPTTLTIFSGVTLEPGLYKIDGILALAGSEILTLDAANDPNAVFIFQIGTGLTLAANSQVILTRGAQAKNVFWQVGTAATFGAAASFSGTVMAGTAITAAPGASFDGQLLAIGTAVTLDNNTINNNANASAPTASVTASPTGTATIGSSLANSITFDGEPSPVVSYAWEFSLNGNSGWSTVADATDSTFTLTNAQAGGYLRTVATATNAAGTLTQTSTATTQILPPAPARPNLAQDSDTGSSSSDGVTSETRPELVLTDLVIGSEVVLTATKDDLAQTCSFIANSATQSCSFSNPLADGTWSLTAVSTVGGYSSAESDSLSITIDTTAPAVETFTVDQASFATSVLTHSLVFTESVTGLEATDFSVESDGVSCNEPTLSGSGTSYTISLANCTGVGDLQLRLSAGATQDLAGNSGPSVDFLTAVATRDETAPTVLFVSSSNANGLLTQGERLEIQVRFSEPVIVSGAPTITLETGTVDRVASYLSGSGTATLVFDYKVGPGDSAADLDYVASNSLALNGGSIADPAGNNAVRTLPAPGEAGSLGANRAFAVDGNLIRLEILPVSSTSHDRSVSWTITALVPLNCNAFSNVAGVDFDFTGLSPLTITSSNSDKTCIISGKSIIGPAQYGISSLSLASTFSFANGDYEPHTTSTGAETDIVVDILPVHDNQGGVTQTPGSGTTLDEYLHELGQGLLAGVGAADVASLLGLGMVNAADAAPTEAIAIDHIGVTGELTSMSRHEISAGDSISLQLEVSDEIATNHMLAAYVKTGENWTYAGSRAFADHAAKTTEFSFTSPGSYHIRLYVVRQDWITPLSLESNFGGFGHGFMPITNVMSITQAALPVVSQSHQAEIIVSGSVTTVTPTEPDDDSSSEGSSSGSEGSSSGSEDSNSGHESSESSPVVTEEPTPGVTEEPTPGVTEEPAQASPGSVTDTGGQLPDTDNGDLSWLIPLGIGGGIAVLGAVVFLMRRRLV